MELALPHASVTWEAKNTTSTIDLVFISTVLQNRIINCGIAKELDHGLDHYPIATELELTPTSVVSSAYSVKKLGPHFSEPYKFQD